MLSFFFFFFFSYVIKHTLKGNIKFLCFVSHKKERKNPKQLKQQQQQKSANKQSVCICVRVPIRVRVCICGLLLCENTLCWSCAENFL